MWKAAQWPFSSLAGKRKANELVSSGDSLESANRCPTPGAESAPLPANSTVTGEKAAVGSRQAGPSGGRATYTMYCPGPSHRLSKLGHSNPQSWIRTRRNPVSQPRQRIGAWQATCPGLLATSQMAPLQKPKWPSWQSHCSWFAVIHTCTLHLWWALQDLVLLKLHSMQWQILITELDVTERHKARHCTILPNPTFNRELPLPLRTWKG